MRSGPNQVRDVAPIPSPSQARVLYAAGQIAAATGDPSTKVPPEAVHGYCLQRGWPGFYGTYRPEEGWQPSLGTVSCRLRDLRVGGLLTSRNRPTDVGKKFLSGARGLVTA